MNERETITVDGATLYSDCPFTPKFARVVLQREDMKSKGGLIIPEEIARRNARNEGLVVGIGPTAQNVELGETVMFGNFSGAWIEREGHEYYIVQDEDLLVRVK